MANIAILSDIHGNLPALTAVLEEVDAIGVTEVLFGGDTVGYGASSAGCVAQVIGRGGRSVLGNHDFYTLGVRKNPRMIPDETREVNPVWAGVAHAAETLSDTDIAWLASLPRTLELPGGILAHASLHRPDDWPYLHNFRDARPTLKYLRQHELGLGFFGHTHRQEFFADPSASALPDELDDCRVLIPTDAVCAVLVGSVGQPRDGDLRAAWVLWDPETRILEFRRTEYPALEAALSILTAGLPAHSAQRLLDGPTVAQLGRMLG